MSNATFKGTPLQLAGSLPEIGTQAPDFRLVKNDLSEVKLSDFASKRVLLNIFPSLDTSVCATSIRKFNQMAACIENTVVLAISKDLPFAHTRFCTTEGIENVVSLSAFRDSNFGNAYGVLLLDSPLAGLFMRAVVVIDENGKVCYTQLVDELTHEPDYDRAIEMLSQNECTQFFS